MSDIGERIDALYDYVDSLCHAGRWAEVDAVLLEHAGERDHRMRIAVLIITLACRSRLSLRAAYAEATHEWLTAQGEDADAALQGLWPERQAEAERVVGVGR